MISARLVDNGQRPVLDIHGCTVDQALSLTRALIAVSVKRGRDSLELIHGSSTSNEEGRRRTIKNTLHSLIDDGMESRHVSQSFKSSSSMTIALRRHAKQTDYRRITLGKIARL